MIGDELQFMQVGQPMQISMGNTMGMSSNPVMAFQRNSIMPSVSSYSESGLSHNISTEDMMGPGIQGIAYIAPDAMMTHPGTMQGDLSLNPMGEMNPNLEMYQPSQIDIPPTTIEYHNDLEGKMRLRPPKRTMSAYSCYSRSVFKEVRDSMGDQPRQCDIFKKIASQWKDMSAEEKKPFEEEARNDHKRYKEEMRKFNKQRRDVEKTVTRYGMFPTKYSKTLYRAFHEKDTIQKVAQILLSSNGNNKKDTADIVRDVVSLLTTSGTTILNDQRLIQSSLANVTSEFERAQSKKPYKCPYPGCNKEFTYKSNLNTHMHIHDPQRTKDYVCQYPNCKKAFYDAQHLKQHCWTHTRSPESFRCPHPGCNKKYNTSAGLHLHIQNHHKNEKKFVCTYEGCSKAFARNTDLNMHIMRVHENERPHKCEVEGCDKSFVSPSELKRHALTHNHFSIADINGVRDIGESSPQMEL